MHNAKCSRNTNFLTIKKFVKLCWAVFLICRMWCFKGILHLDYVCILMGKSGKYSRVPNNTQLQCTLITLMQSYLTMSS